MKFDTTDIISSPSLEIGELYDRAFILMSILRYDITHICNTNFSPITTPLNDAHIVSIMDGVRVTEEIQVVEDVIHNNNQKIDVAPETLHPRRSHRDKHYYKI